MIDTKAWYVDRDDDGFCAASGDKRLGGYQVQLRSDAPHDNEVVSYVVGLHNQRVNDLLTYGDGEAHTTAGGELVRPVRTIPEDASLSEVLHQMVRDCGLEEVQAVLRMVAGAGKMG